MIKCDGVLFDLDGTLWDATEGIAASWAVALADEPDVPRPPTQAELEKVMGMTDKQLVAVIFPQASQERGLELFGKCCKAENEYLRLHGGKLYEGLLPTLKALAEKLPLFIVSNCNLGYIPSFLEAHGLEGYFKDVECSGNTGLDKWRNIKLVAERNGLESPVYIGDTTLDCQSAQKAGVPFIHAAYGFGKVDGTPAVRRPEELFKPAPAMNTSLLFSAFPFISGESVTLAQMSQLDLEGLWAVLGDEENFRYAPTGALPSPAQCSWKLLQAQKLFQDRSAVMLGVYPNSGGQLAGIFEIYNLDPQVESATIRFTLARKYTGRGIATGAVRAAVDYLMADIGVHRIQAYVLPANHRGVLVLERCGFVREGTIREGFFWPDKGIVDLSLFSLLPTDLRRGRSGHLF